jgi:hypothetical protein
LHLLFWLLKFPQNHTILEEKTNRKSEEGEAGKKTSVASYILCAPYAPSWLKFLQFF